MGGSLAIARYVDALPGPALLPPNAADVERWLSAFEEVSIRELSGRISSELYTGDLSDEGAQLELAELRDERRELERAVCEVDPDSPSAVSTTTAPTPIAVASNIMAVRNG